ncbi:MAG: GatB/YqeY domain-containing protein [Thermodesulfobacteriota bacterium]|nr:GatB/YqeY domain-containing protein [Thermodesulfobacteriota bacterium]
MSEEEIRAKIEKAIEEVGAASVRDMGKVMKALMPELTGRADGKVVSELVKERLSS